MYALGSKQKVLQIVRIDIRNKSVAYRHTHTHKHVAYRLYSEHTCIQQEMWLLMAHWLPKWKEQMNVRQVAECVHVP